MGTIFSVSLAIFSLFILVVALVGICEFISDIRQENAYIKKENDLMRKGLERANNDQKPK